MKPEQKDNSPETKNWWYFVLMVIPLYTTGLFVFSVFLFLFLLSLFVHFPRLSVCPWRLHNHCVPLVYLCRFHVVRILPQLFGLVVCLCLVLVLVCIIYLHACLVCFCLLSVLQLPRPFLFVFVFVFYLFFVSALLVYVIFFVFPMFFVIFLCVFLLSLSSQRSWLSTSCTLFSFHLHCMFSLIVFIFFCCICLMSFCTLSFSPGHF